MQMDLVYLPLRTAHAFEPLPFFCSIVSIAVCFNPVNCPSVICLPRIALLSSFGRETSLVKVMGPRSIFPPLFTHSIYFLFSFQLPLSLSLALILCKQQGRRDWQPLCTRWEQSYLLLCAGPRQAPWHLLVSLWVLRETNLCIFVKGNLSLQHPNLPLGVTSEDHYFSAITC